MEGTIKKVMRDKFFGFIAVDGGKDVFFHKNDVENLDEGFSDLAEGDKVEFEIGQSPKGAKAIHVRKV